MPTTGHQLGGGGAEIWTHGLWTYNWADSHRQVLSATANASAARLTLEEHGDYTDRDCQLTAAAKGSQVKPPSAPCGNGYRG